MAGEEALGWGAAGEFLGEGGLAAAELSNPVGWAILGGTALYLGWRYFHSANQQADEAGAEHAPGAVCNCPPGGAPAESSDEPKKIYIDPNAHPEAATHVQDAQASGHPSEVTVDRGADVARRCRVATSSTPSEAGKDRDEYPPAISKEGGSGSSVRNIPLGDNLGAGASMGGQLRDVPNGSRVQIIVGPNPSD